MKFVKMGKGKKLAGKNKVEKKKCKNCLYYEKVKGICQCANSDEVLDFTDKEFVCKWHKLKK